MRSYLGLTPPTAREGILQDVHWSGGGIGYFPTYTLGNVLAAQLSESAEKAMPELRAETEAGHFAGLYEWLRVNVHRRYGKKYPPAAPGEAGDGAGRLSTEPYLRYLTGKFSGIYGL